MQSDNLDTTKILVEYGAELKTRSSINDGKTGKYLTKLLDLRTKIEQSLHKKEVSVDTILLDIKDGLNDAEKFGISKKAVFYSKFNDKNLLDYFQQKLETEMSKKIMENITNYLKEDEVREEAPISSPERPESRELVISPDKSGPAL